MSAAASASNLRNRKKKDDDSPALAEDPVVDAGTELKKAEESSSSSSSSFQLMPLIELPLYARLDVLPFCIVYGLLIAVDYYLAQEEDDEAVGSFILSLFFGSALVGHLGLVLACQWNVSFKTVVGYQIHSTTVTRNNHTKWTHCFVKSKTSVDEAGIVPITHDDNGTVVVNFHDRIFRYASQSPDGDMRLWQPEKKVEIVSEPLFRELRYPMDLPLSFLGKWQGHPSIASATEAAKIYGRNQMILKLPTLTDLLMEQLVAPFFLFQVFCVILWSLDEYWYYAIFTLFALLMFESTMAFNRLQSLQRLHEAGQKNFHQRVWVRRGTAPASVATASTTTATTSKTIPRRWMHVKKHELVPGDLVSIAATGHPVPVPADILLFQGTAVCDEALLTGESIPQLKHPLELEEIVGEDDGVLDCQDSLHKESILFGGTNVLVTNSAGVDLAPDNGVTGIVLRTGFSTTQGNLLRTMAHTQKIDGVHTWDTFVFILLLVACAIGAAVYVLYEGWQDDRRNRFRLILHVILIVTSVVPPELPMELSLAVTNSFAALVRRAQVFCTELFRIPWAGQVNICCFDKTGTLTSDEMILRGVRLFSLPIDDEEKALRLPGEDAFPEDIIRVMVGCQALAVAGFKSTSAGNVPSVVGDPLEFAVLNKSGYRLVANNIVASPNGGKAIAVLHRFAFSSKLKRMTVLAMDQGNDKDLWALTKGAPETMKEFMTTDSIPSNYDEVAFHHMSRGRRVLAMAYRRVGTVHKIEEYKKRDFVESKLTFAGFLVLDCPLKPDTKNVIAEIRESGHRMTMITGDAALTAVEVARQIEMVPRSAEHVVYRIQPKDVHQQPSGGGVLSTIEAIEMSISIQDGAKRLSHEEIKQLKEKGEASFCLTGDCIGHLASLATSHGGNAKNGNASSKDEKALLLDPRVQRVLVDLVPLVTVFARHAPYQKEAVVAALNHAGYTTLMAGDGTNDVGALKRAHVGISIVSAPEVEAKQREASKSISRAKKKGKKSSRATFEESLRQLQEAQNELDQVELGDASVAAPFTSRSSTIKCVKDVIQQGRCTLVTMLQIYKILGINCLVNAMVLSRLFLHGVKQGDRQLTILGIAVAALFFFVTRAEPLTTLSSARPPSSVLCFEAMSSIFLQCFIHLLAILIVSEAALAFVDPYDPSLVPDGPFNPNVLNTCTFIVLCLTTVNTFAVNYRGHPFMQALTENRLLYRSLQVSYAVLLVTALEIFPPLNDLMQLTPLPTITNMGHAETSHPLFQLVQLVGFQTFLPALMALDTVLAFSVERFTRRQAALRPSLS